MRRKIERLENGNLQVTVGFCFRNRSNSRKIVSGDGEDVQMATFDTMMIAIAREPGKVAWTMRLAMLAPDIIHRILSGDIPQNLTLEKLRAPLPDLWEEQRAMLFGESSGRIAGRRTVMFGGLLATSPVQLEWSSSFTSPAAYPEHRNVVGYSSGQGSGSPRYLKYRCPQSLMASIIEALDCPSSVSEYSVFGGITGKSCRFTIPSASISRSCWLSIFAVACGMAFWSSLKRMTPALFRCQTMIALSFPPSTPRVASTEQCHFIAFCLSMSLCSR